MPDIIYKYNEDEILNEIRLYINKTYGAHYDSEDGVQLMDLILAEKDAEAFCKWNGIKYLARYGKKEGHNRKDLMKAIHYCIFLLHNDTDMKINQNTNETIDNETVIIDATHSESPK